MQYIFLIIIAAVLIVRLLYVFGKGYSGKQLWLHFFYHVPTHVIDELDEGYSERYQPLGSRKSACGNVNAVYVTSCSCGRNKDGEEAPEPVAVMDAVTEDNGTQNAAAIREYKKLLDDGIITAEEFAAKKKQLLGL